MHFDPALRDEVVARVDRLNLPSYTGFVMPRLEPLVGTDGRIADVAITYPCDLTTQMLEYLRETAGRPCHRAGAGRFLIRTTGVRAAAGGAESRES